jgi:FtsZ-interacting cell division protein YlmF
VDLRSIDEESDGRRILDFCAGAAFTMRANIEKLASGVFFVSKDQSSTPELRRRFTD